MGKERKERKEKEEWMLRNGGLLLEKRISYFDGKYSNPMRSFSAKELQIATDNYNHKNLIFGYSANFEWYKGCLEGRVVLVKKYMDYSLATHSRRFFRDPDTVTNEISVAAQLSGHKNSLKLLGCCLETQIPTSVFEFPMNGNLKHQLRCNLSCLSWKSRLKFANEIASVITYLHTAFPRTIIHREIHPRHFYLDQDLCAKLSEFRFSMSIPEGKTQVQNEFAWGIVGYVAPEALSMGVYSEKSDVFGFGSLLFYLLTGMDYFELAVSKGLMDHQTDDIQSYIGNHGINGIVDPTILAEGGGVHHHRQFQAILRLILECRTTNVKERPIMLDARMKISVVTDISVTRFYGYIGNIGGNFDTKYR